MSMNVSICESINLYTYCVGIHVIVHISLCVCVWVNFFELLFWNVFMFLESVCYYFLLNLVVELLFLGILSASCSFLLLWFWWHTYEIFYCGATCSWHSDSLISLCLPIGQISLTSCQDPWPPQALFFLSWSCVWGFHFSYYTSQFKFFHLVFLSLLLW